MPDTVSVFVVSPDTRSERRYDLSLTVRQLKSKLESVTGIDSGAQIIRVFDSEDDASSESNGRLLDDDDRPLGYYSVQNWQALKVADSRPPGSGASLTGQFTDVSQVEKFELTDEQYAKRRDTVRTYIEQNHLGRFAVPHPGSSEAAPPPAVSASKSNIALGSRCEVDLSGGGTLTKRGTVRFVGPTNFGAEPRTGEWVGIEYDEPVGKNDGSVEGERYFTCKPKYGGFVRPSKVRVGDYPPLDLDLELDDEEM